jgi:acyl-CoA thioester hydrolase
MMKTLLHTTRVPVRWGDQDALGHVNNTRIVQYVEEARIEALAQAFGGAWPEDGGPILAALTVEFKQPIVYPATVVVRTYGGPPGRTSFPHHYELFLDDADETLLATCDARLVWVGRDGRPAPVPDAIRATLPAADA